MARPNYGFQKRQKEMAKQKKKEEKKQRREAGGPDGAAPEELAEMVAEARERIAAMDPESEMRLMGESLLASINDNPPDISADMVRVFLERTDDEDAS